MRSLLLLTATLWACTGTIKMSPDGGEVLDGDAGSTSDAGLAATTSYLRDIQPIVERSCKSCHTQGGVAPFALDTPDQVTLMAEASWSAIEGNRMPPFFASSSCNTYQNDPRLTAEEKTLFKKWLDEGKPRGMPADERHAMVPQLPVVRHDLDLSIGGDFDARKMGTSDNYQCFVMNPGNTSDVMVTGYEVTPGNRALVHHVLAYAIAPSQVAQLEALDQNAMGLGYPCQSGGVGINGAIRNQIAGWVPGQFPSRMPSNTALVLPAGGRIVMQIHYNLAGVSTGASPFDQTRLALETVPMGSLTQGKILPMLAPNLSIAPNDPNSVQVQEVNASTLYRGATIYRLMPHAHMLATDIKLELLHSDGTSTCLLDNPRWDFNWQRDYTLTTPVTVRTGDRLKITCTYDNSPANQPVINGVQQQPRLVEWGENTTDEMCMTYMTFSQ